MGFYNSHVVNMETHHNFQNMIYCVKRLIHSHMQRVNRETLISLTSSLNNATYTLITFQRALFCIQCTPTKCLT